MRALVTPVRTPAEQREYGAREPRAFALEVLANLQGVQGRWIDRERWKAAFLAIMRNRVERPASAFSSAMVSANQAGLIRIDGKRVTLASQRRRPPCPS